MGKERGNRNNERRRADGKRPPIVLTRLRRRRRLSSPTHNIRTERERRTKGSQRDLCESRRGIKEEPPPSLRSTPADSEKSGATKETEFYIPDNIRQWGIEAIRVEG